MKAIAYCRTSLVLKQDPLLQLVAIKDYATKNGIELVGEYIDQVSGLKSRRPGLDAMLRDSKTKKFDVVIVTALDRLGRNTKNMLELAERFQENKIGLISLRESISLDSPSGKAFFAICSVISQLDRDNICERIRVALASKKIIAEQTGNGWKCGRPSNRSPELENKILQLHTQGLSVRSIEKKIEKKVSRGTIQRVIEAAKATVPNHSEN
jgi:DNA invertase Pin-like site-specific DNA recombinase